MIGTIIPEILGFELASFLDKKIKMCSGTSGSVISGQKIQRELLYPDLGIFKKILFWELS